MTKISRRNCLEIGQFVSEWIFVSLFDFLPLANLASDARARDYHASAPQSYFPCVTFPQSLAITPREILSGEASKLSRYHNQHRWYHRSHQQATMLIKPNERGPAKSCNLVA